MSSRKPHKSRVIVVDDDPYGIAFFESSLKLVPYEVITATSVSEAQQMISSRGCDYFDCVLTDFRMPDQTGLDLLEWVHELDDDLSTIIITAVGKKEVIRQSLKSGAVDFLDKPVSYKALVATVNKAVSETQARRNMKRTAREVKEVGEYKQIFTRLKKKDHDDRIKMFFQPMHELGGDFISFFDLTDQRSVIITGDVSGHDVRSAFVSAYFQGFIRGSSEPSDVDLNQLLDKSSDIIGTEWFLNESPLQGKISQGMSLAVSCLDLDYEGNQLSVYNCGFPPVTLVGAEAQMECISAINPPLGWVPGSHNHSHTYSLDHWDYVYMWSDGLADLANDLSISSFSLAYRLLHSERNKGRILDLEIPDDILAICYHLKADHSMSDVAFQPLIQEQYTGSEHINIDKFQSIWRRSLLYALEDSLGDRLYDLLVCCREAVLNALVHGCDGEEDKVARLEVSWAKETQTIRVRVDDPGRGHNFNIKKRIEELNELEGTHLGLTMINDLSDKFESQNRGSTVVFDFVVQ